MTQNTILENITISFQRIHMSFGTNVNQSHYVTFKLIIRERRPMPLQILPVICLHGQVFFFVYFVYMICKFKFDQNGEPGVSAVSTVAQMEEGKDFEMIIYLDISSESNFKEILEVSIYHRSDLFHALITKLSLYISAAVEYSHQEAARTFNTKEK